MTIASEITRLQNDKAAMCAAIENKGVTVGNVTFDDYAACIDAISQGGSFKIIDARIIGGGGGGGGSCSNNPGGGGGGGGANKATHRGFDKYICVTVGAGGNGGQNGRSNNSYVSCNGCNGGSSCIENIPDGNDVVLGVMEVGGGGGGGCGNNGTGNDGNGAGGGAGANTGAGGCSIYHQGGHGGQPICLGAGGGGGGGITGYGLSGCIQGRNGINGPSCRVGGSGGRGTFLDCFGATSEWYAGGGGGGGYNAAGCGGCGGGGAGNGGNATGCGGGGGGGRPRVTGQGGNGAGGIVIIRYPKDGSYGFTCAEGGNCCYEATGKIMEGCDCTTCYCIHEFTSSGCFCVVS